MPSGFSLGRRKSASVFPPQAILGLAALALLCFLLWCHLLATCWCRHMRWFNEAKSVVPKVGAGETAMILKHYLTLRSKAYHAFTQKLSYFDDDLELMDVLHKAVISGDLTDQGSQHVLKHVDPAEHTHIARRKNSDGSRAGRSLPRWASHLHLSLAWERT